MSTWFNAGVAARGLASQWEEAIQYAGQSYGVPANLIKAVISAESGWDPNAIGRDPQGRPVSYGLMQINATAHGIPPATAEVPSWSITFGTSLLAAQLAKRHSVALALAGYNAGTNRTDGDLLRRIQGNVLAVGDYVATVQMFLDWFDAQGGGGEQLPAPETLPPATAAAPDAALTVTATVAPAPGGIAAAPTLEGLAVLLVIGLVSAWILTR